LSVLLQLLQPFMGWCVAFVGQIVCRARKVVER
jgi:hypothetical protein